MLGRRRLMCSPPLGAPLAAFGNSLPGREVDPMALLNRARQFVEGGNLPKLLLLLADCVAAANSEGMLAVKLLARDMYGGETYNFELKAPAAHCLLAWGEDGIEALAENAVEEPTSKNFSLAFQLLASTAEGRESQLSSSWLPDRQLREAVSRAVGDWNNLALAARRHLHELMLSIEDDDYASLHTGVSLMSLAVQDSGAARNLSHALALRSIAVGPRVLAGYRELLSGKDDDESIFQHFLERHPLLLDPRAFQVWGRPDFHGKLRPDFVIRTYDDSYIIVEIETPAKRIVTKQGQLSAETTHAIRQVLGYQDYLLTHFPTAAEAFPKFSSPAGLVVIGLESSLESSQKEVLRVENRSRADISIVGFDTLADTAGKVTNNVIHGIPGALMGERLP